jgi:hypothetical protein
MSRKTLLILTATYTLIFAVCLFLERYFFIGILPRNPQAFIQGLPDFFKAFSNGWFVFFYFRCFAAIVGLLCVFIIVVEVRRGGYFHPTATALYSTLLCALFAIVSLFAVDIGVNGAERIFATWDARAFTVAFGLVLFGAGLVWRKYAVGFARHFDDAITSPTNPAYVAKQRGEAQQRRILWEMRDTRDTPMELLYAADEARQAGYLEKAMELEQEARRQSFIESVAEAAVREHPDWEPERTARLIVAQYQKRNHENAHPQHQATENFEREQEEKLFHFEKHMVKQVEDVIHRHFPYTKKQETVPNLLDQVVMKTEILQSRNGDYATEDEQTSPNGNKDRK